jgi:hypothetical protein
MKKQALLGLVLASLAVAGIWKLRGGETETTTKRMVLDRIWVDHMPKHDRDIFHIFLAITEQPFGIFQSTSQWKGEFELFTYEAHGDEIRIVYGQTGEKEKVKAHARECDEKGFDYCLELKGNSRGVKKYYSLEGWEIDTANLDEVRARARELIRQANPGD